MFDMRLYFGDGNAHGMKERFGDVDVVYTAADKNSCLFLLPIERFFVIVKQYLKINLIDNRWLPSNPDMLIPHR